MYVVSRLFTPLNYLKIIHPHKLYYDLYIPAAVSIFATTVLIVLPLPVKFFDSNGVIEGITGILQILSGFYIASLAAVATFKKEGMDQPLAGRPLTLNVLINGRHRSETLTRRRFLCLLFGYLALLSIFLYFVGVCANLLVNNISYIAPDGMRLYIKWGFVFLYLFLSANLVTTTLHGLFYMVDRIHRSDPELIVNNGNNNNGRAVKLVDHKQS